MLPWFNTQEQNIDDLIRRIPEELPILPLRNTVAFPYIVMPLAVGIPRSVRLIEDVDRGDRMVGLVAMKDPSVEIPSTTQVYQVGTAAIIHRVMRSDDGTLTVFIQGLERFRVVEWTAEEPYLQARIRLTPDIVESSVIEEALRRSLLDVATRLAELIPQFPDEAVRFIQQLEDPRLLVYLLASNMRIDMSEAQRLLEVDRLTQKMEHLVKVLTHELEVREIGQQIQEKAKEEIEALLRQGIQAYAVPVQAGTAAGEVVYHVYAGGYETREAAEPLREQIETAGLSAELIERVGLLER